MHLVNHTNDGTQLIEATLVAGPTCFIVHSTEEFLIHTASNLCDTGFTTQILTGACSPEHCLSSQSRIDICELELSYKNSKATRFIVGWLTGISKNAWLEGKAPRPELQQQSTRGQYLQLWLLKRITPVSLQYALELFATIKTLTADGTARKYPLCTTNL